MSSHAIWAVRRFPQDHKKTHTSGLSDLLNVMCAMDAVEKGGGPYGIWVEEGTEYVIEGAVCSAVFITEDRHLVTPTFSTALESVTARRVLALGQKLLAAGKLNAVEQRDITATEAKTTSTEMFLCGGDTHINPVSHWDGHQIGDGSVGAITREIYEMILAEESAETEFDPEIHIDIYAEAEAEAASDN